MIGTNTSVQHRGATVGADTCHSALPRRSSTLERPSAPSRRLSVMWRRVACGPAVLHRYGRRRTRCLVLLSSAVFMGLVLVTLTAPFVANPMTWINEQLYGLRSLQRSLFFEDEVHASAGQPAGAHGGVCALCADGGVLFRADAHADAYAQPAPHGAGGGFHESVVCHESVEDQRSAREAPHQFPLHTAHDCVARLFNLGLLRPPRATETVAHNASCVQVRVSLRILDDGVAASTQCAAVLAQLHRAPGDANIVELATPRLTVWPLPSPPDQATDEGHRWPPYVGTAAVKDTDVDRDVPPPSAIYVDDAANAVVLQFSGTATADGAEAADGVPPSAPQELHCPLHFLTVRLGRFGRHHNQLQEILNGIALATRLNRTFILPAFVPALYTNFLKLDTEIFYGWNVLRRDGRYCLLTYTEARPLLRRTFTDQQRMMPMARVHLVLDAEAQAEWAGLSAADSAFRAWGYLPRVPSAAKTPVYDADEWFACGVRNTRSGFALLPSGGETSLLLSETHPPFTAAALHDMGGANGTSWENFHEAALAMVDRYGGGTRRSTDAGAAPAAASSNQPALLVLSSYTAFHLRPRLVEMTRLLGLLRPSPYITSEVGRYYRLWARQYKWPPYTSERRTFEDCLQPFRFRGVVGIHVRRRELTCRREAENPRHTLLALSGGRYQLDGTGRYDRLRGPSPASSTVARIANDCVWDVRSVVHLFRQYSQWMAAQGPRATPAVPAEEGQGTAVANGSATHHTSYVAYDEQAGPIGQEMEMELQRSYQPTASELLADGTRPSFAAVYDRRSRVDFMEVYKRATERVQAPAVAEPANATAVQAAAEWRMDYLIKLLYPTAELELMGLTFDFFMLSNTEVFRGNGLSSVSINVCVRRWGRGLPCHGVMAGYYETLYKGFP